MPVIYDIGDGEGCTLSDQDDLLHQDDTDSTTDSEDTVATCSARASLNRECADDNNENSETKKPRSPLREKLDICLTGLSLSLSTTVLTVIYPAYLRSVIRISSSYVAILFPSTMCFFSLLTMVALLGWYGHFDGFPITRCPLPVKRLSRGAISYAVGCCLVVLAQTPGRVPCHLQDPLKAVVILFSLLYYFFFCKKMLGLRKLFAASVLAVGLFIAADYGLCDEFKCRGTQSHLEGRWEARAGWTMLYLTGLALFTLHFTLTEEQIQCSGEVLSDSSSNSLLSTVSRMVSQNESCDQLANGNTSQDSFRMEMDRCCLLIVQEKKSKKLCILTTLWIQGLTWLFIVISGTLLLVMSNFTTLNLPNESVINITMNGLICHLPRITFEKPVQHLVSSSPMDFNKNEDYFNRIHNNFHKDEINAHSRSKFEHYLEHLHLYNSESRTNIAKKILDSAHILKKKHENKNSHTNSSAVEKTNVKNRKPQQRKISKKHKHDHKKDNENENLRNRHNSSIADFHAVANHSVRELSAKIRVKRKALESLASGFKIIQPTISLLKDHTITSKMKPNLIGHIILNKTDANINGHKMASDYRPAIVDADSLLSYYMRRNRNGLKVASKNIDGKKKMHSKKHKRNKSKHNEIKLKRIKRDVLSTENYNALKSEHNSSKNNGDIDDDPNRHSNHVNSDFLYTITKLDKNYCSYIPSYGWTVFLAYTGFSISSLRFLKLCQSSVFTIAMMTPALPLTGIWWAVFTHTTDGGLIVEPTISGELICALLSLPIILLGLTLLFKAQLNQSSNQPSAGASSQSYLSR